MTSRRRDKRMKASESRPTSYRRIYGKYRDLLWTRVLGDKDSAAFFLRYYQAIFYELQISLPSRFIVACLVGRRRIRHAGVETAGEAVAQADSPGALRSRSVAGTQ